MLTMTGFMFCLYGHPHRSAKQAHDCTVAHRLALVAELQPVLAAAAQRNAQRAVRQPDNEQAD